MAKKKSEQGAVVAWFSLAPLDQCESAYAIVSEVMRRRRKEGKPKAERKPKVKPTVSALPNPLTPGVLDRAGRQDP
jgi:hypothetical protein